MINNNWQIRAGRGGVCDFKECFEFYFKWLTNKIMSCFIISDAAPEERTQSINWSYAKMNLILDGQICITDFKGKLYACIGNRGGEPDEYYVPKRFLIANPILGSKDVRIGEDGVVIYNTKIDEFMFTGSSCIFATGLYDLISQTATLLADNIISINCVQINARVNTFFTADSESQAVAGEAILKKQYAGRPYQILRSDLLEKIQINPVNTSAAGQTITELVELHNYIIANFFQSIGIKSNNVMKRERLIKDEIESQDDFLQVSILEILSSWQEGLDQVNKMYGTDFSVRLNPVLINELMEQLEPAEAEASPENAESTPESETESEGNDTLENTEASIDDAESSSEAETETEDNDTSEETEAAPEEAESTPEDKAEEVINDIEDKEEVIDEVVDLVNDANDSQGGIENVKPDEENEPADSD